MADKAGTPPVPEPAPVILEENLTGLPFLRNLILGLFFEWSADQGDEDVVSFMSSVKQVFLEPLVSFDKAYDLFCKHCTDHEKANKVGDHWRVFQMVVWSELDEELVTTMQKFQRMAFRVMAEAPGGEQLVPRKLREGASQHEPKEIKVPFDYLVLLAIRIYIGAVRPVSAPKS